MIELDPRLKTPLYEQLYAAWRTEIRRGDRAPGTPLPGRRTMAAQQGVSVNTVDTALPDAGSRGPGRTAPPQRFLRAENLRHAAYPHAAPGPAGCCACRPGACGRTRHAV